jgi:phage FluMu protein Com
MTTTKELREIRCQQCKKLLCKMTPDAVKASEQIEIKCKCNAMNYLIGQPDHG